jgi:hypothetical protein
MPLSPAAVESNTTHTSGFSYRVLTRTILDTASDSTIVTVDGKSITVKKTQICVDLKDPTKLQSLEVKHHLKLLQQEILPGKPTLTGSRLDGTFRQIPSSKKRVTSSYLFDYTPDPTETLNAMPELAKQQGITGQYVFATQQDALLFNRVLKLREDTDSGVQAADANKLTKPCFADTEGASANNPSGGNQISPDSPDFWWTGGMHQGSHMQYGANLNKDNDYAAWNYRSGRNVEVAVIDSGYYTTGEGYMPSTIVRNAYYSYNFITNNYDVSGPGAAGKEPWHGRTVSSLIFAPDGDGNGTVGTANGATPILFTTDYTSWKNKSCIDTAVYWGAKVINMSYGLDNYAWGISPDSGSIQSAANQGVILVAGAGNGGYDTAWYPAAYTGYVISVGATDQNGHLSNWGGGFSSNYAPFVSIYAPGSGVASADDLAKATALQYWPENGTSVAAPIVTGIVASMVEGGLVSNYSTAYNRLRSTADTFPINTQGYSSPLEVDALRAIRGTP